MENLNVKAVNDDAGIEDRFITTIEFCSILDTVGTIHITKNCLKYSLIDIEYVKSKFYAVTDKENTLFISK